jgi:multidrug efflux system membrane fusion protein
MADNVSKAGAPGHFAQTPVQRQEKKEHHWGTWILIILVVAAGIAAFFLFGEKKPASRPIPAASITVTNVQRGDIAVAVSSLGSVQPVYTATISPRVDGQVITVNYTEGQMVKSNDLLAVIDPGPYQAQMTVANGQLDRDKAVLEGAKVDLGRYQAAYAKKAIPKQQVDDQVALVHQDEGAVSLDEGQVTNAKVNLDYCYIHAPFAGSVGLRLIDPGNIVHAANTNAMVVVAQLKPITVVFNVAEDYLPQIEEQLQAGHEMSVEAWDRANENIIATGKVLALNNMIDAATGTIRIKAVFDNDKMTLFPNQFVNAKLIIKILHDQNLVPTYAIQRNPEGAFLYVLTNPPPATNSAAMGTNGPDTNMVVTMRPVTPGVSDGNTTAIANGAEPGQTIALDNFNKLGENVRVVPRKSENENPVDGGHRKGGGQHKKKKPDDSTDKS